MENNLAISTKITNTLTFLSSVPTSRNVFYRFISSMWKNICCLLQWINIVNKRGRLGWREREGKREGEEKLKRLSMRFESNKLKIMSINGILCLILQTEDNVIPYVLLWRDLQDTFQVKKARCMLVYNTLTLLYKRGTIYIICYYLCKLWKDT